MVTSNFMGPLLSAFHKTITSITTRFIATNPHRCVAKYAASINGGMAEVARAEIRSKFNVDSKIEEGRIIFETDSELNHVLKLRSFNNVFVVMYSELLKDEDMPTDAESLERLLFQIGDRCDWRTGLAKWLEMSGFDCDIDTLLTKDPKLKDRQPKFRISSNRYGADHKFTSPEVCSLFGHVVDTKFGWPIKLKGMDLDIYCNFIENRVSVNVTLTPICLSFRNIQMTGLTTLKAAVCYAMLKKANIQMGDILVDPMAGSGAIPIECSDCYHSGEMFAMSIAGELRKQTIRKCAANGHFFALDKEDARPPADFLRLDVTSQPFRDNSIDVFVSDLPFGFRHGSKEINEKLYPALLREMGRTARLSTGRAILLTHDYKNMCSAHEAHRDLWTMESYDMVKIGNLKCFIYKFDRTNSPFVRDTHDEKISNDNDD